MTSKWHKNSESYYSKIIHGEARLALYDRRGFFDLYLFVGGACTELGIINTLDPAQAKRLSTLRLKKYRRDLRFWMSS